MGMEDETHAEPFAEEAPGVCANCRGPSEGGAEVMEWFGDELHYFCGQGCLDEFACEWEVEEAGRREAGARRQDSGDRIQETGDGGAVTMTIKGQAPAKSNSYRIVALPAHRSGITGKSIKQHSALAKSGEMRRYEELFLLQIPPQYRGLMIESVMRVEMDCYFRSMASDLDNAAKSPLDCLQKGRVIRNDNKIIELAMRKFIDRDDPRMVITIKTLGV